MELGVSSDSELVLRTQRAWKPVFFSLILKIGDDFDTLQSRKMPTWASATDKSFPLGVRSITIVYSMMSYHLRDTKWLKLFQKFPQFLLNVKFFSQLYTYIKTTLLSFSIHGHSSLKNNPLNLPYTFLFGWLHSIWLNLETANWGHVSIFQLYFNFLLLYS